MGLKTGNQSAGLAVVVVTTKSGLWTWVASCDVMLEVNLWSNYFISNNAEKCIFREVKYSRLLLTFLCYFHMAAIIHARSTEERLI